MKLILLGMVLFGLAWIYRTFARTDRSWIDFAKQRGGRARGRQLSDGFDLVRHGVELWLRGYRLDSQGGELIEVRAAVRVPPGVRLWQLREWNELRVPKLTADLRELPLVVGRDEMRGEIRSDRPEVLAQLGALTDAWSIIAGQQIRVVIACDGRTVSGIIADEQITIEAIDAMLDAVAAVAAWDDGLSERMAALPGATPLTDHELDPGVSLALDGLLVGVRDHERTVAQLGFEAEPAKAQVVDGAVTVDGPLPGPVVALLAAAGDGELLVTAKGARYTWASIERETTRLSAGIEALRVLAGRASPYR